MAIMLVIMMPINGTKNSGTTTAFEIEFGSRFFTRPSIYK